MTRVTVSSIVAAADLLRGVAEITPVLTNPMLDDESGARVLLKCENLQRTGAFKFRGAYHAVARLIDREQVKTFATISSGNHGQGLALACQMHGVTAHVVMPEPFSAVKHRAVLDHGATVYIVEGRHCAEERLQDVVERHGARVVHPFNDPLVIAGQGTIMLEFLEQAKGLDAVLAPVGGGGLLSGLCVVAEACRPSVKIFACEPAGALDAVLSVKENQVVPVIHPRTMADGLRTSLGSETLPILRRCLTGFFIVHEEEIIRAMRFAYDRLKMVIEPSSAVALAPLLRKEPELVGRRVGVVLTGRNVDPSIMSGDEA